MKRNVIHYRKIIETLIQEAKENNIDIFVNQNMLLIKNEKETTGIILEKRD